MATWHRSRTGPKGTRSASFGRTPTSAELADKKHRRDARNERYRMKQEAKVLTAKDKRKAAQAASGAYAAGSMAPAAAEAFDEGDSYTYNDHRKYVYKSSKDGGSADTTESNLVKTLAFGDGSDPRSIGPNRRG